MCEASKGVEDIFSGNHQLWKSFDAGSSVCDHDDTVLDPLLNSAPMVRMRFVENVMNVGRYRRRGRERTKKGQKKNLVSKTRPCVFVRSFG